MSTSVQRNRPRQRGVCWIVGVGLLLCGCRSPLFTTGLNEPAEKRDSGGETDRDSIQTPAWKRDFDRYAAAHSRRASPIHQVSAEVPAVSSNHRNRKPTGSVSGGSVSGGSVSELLNRGHRAAAAGRTAQAQRAYRRVLVDEPNNTVAHHRLAIIADSQHDFDSADYHYHRALQRDHNNPDLLSDLGYSYLLQKRYQESEDFLREAVRLSPEHLRAWSNLGLLFAVEGDHDRSLAAFRRSGSEREAQARVAALFRNGRPRGGPAEGRAEPAPPQDSVRAPQPVPTGFSQRAIVRTEPIAERSPISAPGRQPVQHGSESLTRQLQEAMQAARQQRDFNSRPIRSPGRVAAATAGTNFDPRRTTSIPDDRINRTFSDIDRDGRLLERSRSSKISVTGARRNQALPNARVLSGRPNSSAAPTTGSDSSLLWPPGSAVGTRVRPHNRPRRAVRQTAYSGGLRQNRPSNAWNDETRRAARIGLSAGPGIVLPASPATQAPTADPLRGNSSAAEVFRKDSRTRGSSYRSTTPLPHNRFSDLPPPTGTPRRSPRTTVDRPLRSRQVFVPAQNRPTGYQMRSESARRIDPPPYQPSQRPVASNRRDRSTTIPYQPPRYGYHPPPYRSQTSGAPTGRTIQTSLNQQARLSNAPQPYRPRYGGVSRRVAERFDRPRITPGASSSLVGTSRNGLPIRQGERSFAVPPSNARPVIIPQQFLPR